LGPIPNPQSPIIPVEQYLELILPQFINAISFL
jgi:hypothetical protein